MPRSTPLLSSKAPVVNPGEIVLPVLTSVGDWHELTASPVQWRTIVVDLARALGLEVRTLRTRVVQSVPSHASPSLRQPILKPKGRLT